MLNKKSKRLISKTKMSLYSIYDTLSEEYAPLFQAKNNQVAIRQFKEALKTCPYPTDFQLWHVGTVSPECELYQDLYQIEVPSRDTEEKKVIEKGKQIINNNPAPKEYIDKLLDRHLPIQKGEDI